MLNIKDKSLMYYLMTTLNKKDITEQDLNTIEAISLDSLYIDGTRNTLDFSVLLLFPKLKQLTISNTILSNIDKGYIEQTNIKKLYLIKSTFSSIESYSILNKLEFLSLQNCYVEDYNLLLSNASNLKHLEIINPIDDNEIDGYKIPIFIKNLVLNGCIVKNSNYLKNLKECENISLFNTNIIEDNLEFLLFMPKLKTLYISDKYKTDDNLYILKNRVNIYFDLRNITFEEKELK